MNQNEFFNILMDGLKDFPEIKLQDIISYYEKSFTLGLATGKTEEEIVNELGNPTLIVTKYRNEDLKTPINSENITTDADITPISNRSSINDSYCANNMNFVNNDTIFIEDQNIVTNNEDNDIFSDFKTNDNFNNHTSIDSEKDFEINNTANTFKTSNFYEDINLDSNLYRLDNSNTCSDSTEGNCKSTNSNQSTCDFTGEVDSNLNNDNYNCNSNSSSYKNSNFNSSQNSDYNSNNYNNQSSKNRILQFNINTLLKICIVILATIIFLPVITGIIGFVIGLFGVALSILVASIGVLVGGTFTSVIGLPHLPMFVANFPYPVLVLFSLASILLSIFLIILFYYLCKFFIKLSIKVYTSLKSKRGEF